MKMNANLKHRVWFHSLTSMNIKTVRWKISWNAANEKRKKYDE